MGWTRDVAYAVRQLLRAPGFAAAVVATLGLGIGLTTAVLTVTNAVLLRPLAFPNADRLVRLVDEPSSGGTGVFGRVASALEPEEFAELEASVQSLAQIGVYVGATSTLTGRGDATALSVTRMSASFFPMLGVAPLLGRGFERAEESGHAATVVVLSHRLWNQRFGGARSAVGQTVVLDGQPVTVVGVMPPSFVFPDAMTDAWMPFRPTRVPGRSQRFAVSGALRSSVPIDRAATEVSAALQELRGFPSMQDYRAAGEPLPFSLVLWKEELVGPVRPALLLLSAAAAFVLLAACANVMASLLARGTVRAGEVATRLAIGASRGRVVRLLLIEALVLGGVGGVGGLVVATGALGALTTWGRVLVRRDLGPGVSLPRLDEIGVDPTTFAIAASLALLTALAAGLWPAVRLSGLGRHAQIVGWLRGVREPSGPDRAAGFGPLIVLQVALATALLVSSAAVAQGFIRLVRTELGFDASRVLTFRLTYPAGRYDRTAGEAFSHRVVEQLAAVPGVRSASYSWHLPLAQGRAGGTVMTMPVAYGQPPEGDGPTWQRSAHTWLHHDYFRTLGLRVLQGRALTAQDDAQHARVVMVNEALVRTGLLGPAPVGRQVYFSDSREPWEVVGVVGDFVREGIGQPAMPEVYFDARQRPALPGMPGRGPYVVVKTVGEPLPLVPSIRAALARADGEASMIDIATMEQVVGHARSRPRFYTGLMLTFAGAALAIAAAGIFAVVGYVVAQRRREIGIRLALGAAPARVVRELTTRASGQWGLGVLLGLVGATGLGRFVHAWLVGVGTPQGSMYVTAALVVSVVAAAAAALPARRAAAVDPAQTLRSE